MVSSHDITKFKGKNKIKLPSYELGSIKCVIVWASSVEHMITENQPIVCSIESVFGCLSK